MWRIMNGEWDAVFKDIIILMQVMLGKIIIGYEFPDFNRNNSLSIQ